MTVGLQRLRDTRRAVLNRQEVTLVSQLLWGRRLQPGPGVQRDWQQPVVAALATTWNLVVRWRSCIAERRPF
jgi:hypothetical protein